MGEAAEAPGFQLKPAESQPVGMSQEEAEIQQKPPRIQQRPLRSHHQSAVDLGFCQAAGHQSEGPSRPSPPSRLPGCGHRDLVEGGTKWKSLQVNSDER